MQKRDNEMAAEVVEPLKVQIQGFSSLGVLTLKFNRSLKTERRLLAAEKMAEKLDQALNDNLTLMVTSPSDEEAEEVSFSWKIIEF